MEFGDSFEQKLEEAFQIFKSLQPDLPAEVTAQMWVVDILSKHMYELLRRKFVSENSGQKKG